jgi:hypothetical protein
MVVRPKRASPDARHAIKRPEMRRWDTDLLSATGANMLPDVRTRHRSCVRQRADKPGVEMLE